jgi:hypothetical protein
VLVVVAVLEPLLPARRLEFFWQLGTTHPLSTHLDIHQEYFISNLLIYLTISPRLHNIARLEARHPSLSASLHHPSHHIHHGVPSPQAYHRKLTR